MNENNIKYPHDLAWIDQHDDWQQIWLMHYMRSRQLLSPANQPYFLPTNYTWPGDSADRSRFIASLRESWLLEKELDWVHYADPIQTKWLHTKLQNAGKLHNSQFANTAPTSFYPSDYNWGTGTDRKILIKELKKKWKQTGLDWSWIHQNNKVQTQWAKRQLAHYSRKTRISEHTFAIKNFDLVLFSLPEDENKRRGIIINLKQEWQKIDAFKFINPDDQAISFWAHQFILNKGITSKTNTYFSNAFDPSIYQWPSDELRTQVLDELKNKYALKSKLEWIDPSDEEKCRWIQAFLIREGIYVIIDEDHSSTPMQPGQANSNTEQYPTDFSTKNYIWPSNEKDLKTLISSLRTGWKKEKKDFSWINRNNHTQCNWANNYLIKKGHKRNDPFTNHPKLGIDLKKFNLFHFILPQGQERIDLIDKMKGAWQANKSRSKKNDLAFNVTIHRLAHQQLKTLAKLSQQHLSDVVEDLIVHAHDINSLYNDKYNNKLKQKLIEHDLDFNASEKLKSQDQSKKKLEIRIRNLENRYNSLLLYSSSQLKAYCKAAELIKKSELNHDDLTDIDIKRAESQYKRLEKKYLKPLAPKSQSIKINDTI